MCVCVCARELACVCHYGILFSYLLFSFPSHVPLSDRMLRWTLMGRLRSKTGVCIQRLIYGVNIAERELVKLLQICKFLLLCFYLSWFSKSACVISLFCFSSSTISCEISWEVSFVCWGCRLYYTQVGLGTPMQSFYLQVDTGSDLLWVNCAPCNNCPSSSGLNVSFNSMLLPLW